MKKKTILFVLLIIMAFPINSYAFTLPSLKLPKSLDLTKKLKMSAIKDRVTTSFSAFSSLKNKAAGALSNPGSFLADYTVVAFEDQMQEVTQKISKYTAFKPSKDFLASKTKGLTHPILGKDEYSVLAKIDLKSLQASSINTVDQLILQQETADDFNDELWRATRAVNGDLNNNALKSQNQNLNAETLIEDRTDTTKELNDEMDKILKLVDKICIYQSPEIPCFPSESEAPVEEE